MSAPRRRDPARAGRGAPPLLLLAAAGVVAVTVVAALVSGGKGGGKGGVSGVGSVFGLPHPSEFEPRPRTYTFVLSGADEDLPWNRTVYLSRPGVPGEAADLPLQFLDTRRLPALGVPGTEWVVRTELAREPVVDRMLRVVTRRGRFGDASEVVLELPRRAGFTTTGAPPTTDETYTFAEPSGRGRLVARRDERTGLRWAVWEQGGGPWASQRDPAPTFPWTWGEVPEGTFVVGVRSGDLPWTARELTFRNGEVATIDLSGARPGGGTIVCDDGTAELLLGGKLTIPALRLSELHYRTTWTGVPAGEHAILRSDGRREPVVVPEGGTVTVPKETVPK